MSDLPTPKSSEDDSADAEKARPKVYLVDGYSNIFRAFYAIRNLSSTQGEPTNAIFGFLQILRKLLRDESPAYLGIAMDTSSDTVRKDKYEDYKANRKPMPEDLRPQIPWIRKVIEAYGIPMVEMHKYEADDVMGTLASRATAEGYDVILVSPDKDLMQLVGDGVYMHHTGRDKLYDAQGVAEDFGVPPEQVVDVLALMGDASDNVPGVPGIGEKGAKKLVAEHGSLEALLDAADSIKRKSYREGLQEHRDKAMLSKELVTIHRDLDVPFEPDALAVQEPDWEALLELCRRLDFHQIAKEIEEAQGAATPPPEPARELDTVEAFSGSAPRRGRLAVATLGEGLPHTEPLGLAVANLGDEEEAEAFFVDFRREGLRAAALERLAAWVEDPEVVLVGHDLKEVLRLLGTRPSVACRLVDVMLGSYLTRTSMRSHDFEAVVVDRLHQNPMSFQDAGLAKGELPMTGDGRLGALASERVLFPGRMAEAVEKDLERQELNDVYDELEASLIPVLSTMEETGILIDSDFLGGMSAELADELTEVEKKIYDIAGETFNIQSPKQLGEIMFVKLEYPVLRKTRKTKSWSTDAETLEELAARGYELPERILHFREMAKLKSTYVDVLPALADDEGRVHTRFNQAVAATGRLSSAHPNLQNIPIRTERGQQIRKAFVAGPGRLLVVADYSQIELRVLAHMAEESVMIDAFKRGEDIHAATAATVFGGSPLLINPEQRRIAKVINFGIIYGMTAFGLGRQLGVSRSDAQSFIDTYMEQYPGVRGYTEKTLETAFETRRVHTLYGRVRELPDIRSRNWNLRENAKRMAINAPIQGTAADLLKKAMIAVASRLWKDLPDCRLLLTVHDELVLEGPEDQAEDLAACVREEMEAVADLQVPLVVDAGIGKTWYDSKG